MGDARPQRLAALIDDLADAGLDAILVSALPNIRYLTGFSGSNALLVVAPAGATIVTDFRYQAQVQEEVGAMARIVVEPASLWTAVWRTLRDLSGISVVGFEAAHTLLRDHERLLEAGAAWEWRGTAEMVERLRVRKDAQEVEAIRKAAEVATEALRRTLEAVQAGMSELELAGVLEHALRDGGSEGFPFPTIVAAGARSALPHAQPTQHRVRRGDFLLFDFGAVVDGYCSDITRTVVVGKASADQREVYGVVQAAQTAALEGVRAGMAGRDADALARSYIERHGLGELFGHSLGHGIGLEIHEAPRLARTAEEQLPAGAVVTVEPGVYRVGWGGVRIEDDVWLDLEGTRRLSEFPRDLIEVG